MDYKARYDHWVNHPTLDEGIRAELLAIADDENEIKERFYCDLSFGTGGLRGVLGAGTNRMNVYTVRKATRGFAEYMIANGEEACRMGVVIAHDNRRLSRAFAEDTASKITAEGSLPSSCFTIRTFARSAQIDNCSLAAARKVSAAATVTVFF